MLQGFEITFVERHENMIHGNKFTYKINRKKYQVTTSETIDITQTGEDYDDAKKDIIDTINKIDDDVKDRVEDDVNSDSTQTGFEVKNTDEFINDNTADEAKDIRYEDGDNLGDW